MHSISNDVNADEEEEEEEVVVAAGVVVLPWRICLTFHDIWSFPFLLRVRGEDQYHSLICSWRKEEQETSLA